MRLLKVLTLIVASTCILFPLTGQSIDTPESSGFYQRRGIDHFMEGRFEEAIADFNKVIELDPRMEARHWQNTTLNWQPLSIP